MLICGKRWEAYETKEDLYFKGKLDNDFFLMELSGL